MPATFALGADAVLTLYVTDSNGNAANATSVTCVITRPDGTTATGSVTNTATGTYSVTWATAAVGLHSAFWTATGTPTRTFEEVFSVQSLTPLPVSLTDVKAHLNITNTEYDQELIAFMDAATAAIEQRVGPMTRRTVTETHDGGGKVLLRTYPVISLTTVTDNGITLTSGQYRERDGVVTKKSGTSATNFTTGLDGVSITYQAGRTSVPADLRQAVLEQVRHMWETQRGQQRGRRGGDDYTPGAAFNLTIRVKELIAPYELPGIA
jgi:uncharacterized phiE125 gp8 family phage protein